MNWIKIGGMQTLSKSRRATSINMQQPPWHLIAASITLSAGNKFPTNSCSFKLVAKATFPLESQIFACSVSPPCANMTVNASFGLIVMNGMMKNWLFWSKKIQISMHKLRWSHLFMNKSIGIWAKLFTIWTFPAKAFGNRETLTRLSNQITILVLTE